jgi:acylphosphatase
MTTTQHLLVSGRVQGVSFRHFTHKLASELGVSGWVRNLIDGRVEVMAQAPEAAMNQFVEALRRGPPAGEVRDIVQTEVKNSNLERGFRVIEDGDQVWTQK